MREVAALRIDSERNANPMRGWSGHSDAAGSDRNVDLKALKGKAEPG
jgi:hypothetical protein